MIMMKHDPVEEFDAPLTAEESAEQEARQRRQRLLNTLRGRWHWVVIIGLVLGVFFATAGYFSQKTLYASTGRIKLTQYLPQATADDINGFTSSNFLATEIELLKSPKVLELVTQDEEWRQAAGEDADSIGTIAGSLRASTVGKTSLIDLTFTHEDKRVAVVGLRALMEAHEKAFSSKYQNIDQAKLEQLQTRLSDKSARLINLRAQRDNLTKDLGTATLTPLYEAKFEEVQKYESMLNDVKLALIALGASLQGSESPLQNYSDDQLVDVDAVLRDLRGRLQGIDLQMKTLRQKGMGDNHRQMQGLVDLTETYTTEFQERANQLRQGFVAPQSARSGVSMTADASIEQLQQKQKELEKQLVTAKAELTDIGQKNQQIAILNEEISNIEDDIRKVNDNMERMSIAGIGDHIEVVSSASSARPDNGKRNKLAVLGFMFGFACSFSLVVAWGLFDQRFRHITDAELDLPHVLGSLPTLPEKFEDNEQAVLVAHSVHHIRTLLQIGREDATNVFSITSPDAGAGKTSLTMALGISFASSGSRTLLIDCDIVGGGLTRRMNVSVRKRLGQVLQAEGLVDEHAIDEALKAQQISSKKIGEVLVGLGYVSKEDIDHALEIQKHSAVGLLEVCQGESFATCVSHTGIDNLDILPIGSALPQHAGTLSPGAIKRILANARAAYDVVLIDAGPILGSLEASMTAAEADGTILIVRRGDKKPVVEKCIAHCKRVHAKLIGVVFNHALESDIARSNYGSVAMSQSRHPNQQNVTELLDADTSTRYGPLATAVASYGSDTTRNRNKSQNNGKKSA